MLKNIRGVHEWMGYSGKSPNSINRWVTVEIMDFTQMTVDLGIFGNNNLWKAQWKSGLVVPDSTSRRPRNANTCEPSEGYITAVPTSNREGGSHRITLAQRCCGRTRLKKVVPCSMLPPGNVLP